MRLNAIGRQLGMVSLKRVNTRAVDIWDDASDSMIESESQRSARFQSQLRRDRERAKLKRDFEHKHKKEKQNINTARKHNRS